MPEQETKTAVARHPLLCRWWLGTRHVAPVLHSDGLNGTWIASQEIYVATWAWLFELAHRAIFGRAKLIGQ